MDDPSTEHDRVAIPKTFSLFFSFFSPQALCLGFLCACSSAVSFFRNCRFIARVDTGGLTSQDEGDIDLNDKGADLYGPLMEE